MDTNIYIGAAPSSNHAISPQRLSTDNWQSVVNGWTLDSKAVIFESYRNGRWAIFQQAVGDKAAQGWNPEVDLVEFARLFGHPNWANVQDRLRGEGLPLESEVYLGGGFWQIRGTRLSSNDSNEASQWMVVVTGLTSRLESSCPPGFRLIIRSSA
jgi:hypothetical protein